MVAFGTEDAIKLLEFKSQIGSSTADVLFYASHSRSKPMLAVTYRARFLTYVGAVLNEPPDEYRHCRPASTLSDTAWSGFYIVTDLHEVSPIPLSSLTKANVKGKLKSNFIPHGPLIIRSICE